jgi:hypothetical protein
VSYLKYVIVACAAASLIHGANARAILLLDFASSAIVTDLNDRDNSNSPVVTMDNLVAHQSVPSIVPAPGPIVGTGLSGILFAGIGLVTWWRKRTRKKKAVTSDQRQSLNIGNNRRGIEVTETETQVLEFYLRQLARRSFIAPHARSAPQSRRLALDDSAEAKI